MDKTLTKCHWGTSLVRPLPVFVIVLYSLLALNLTGFPWFAKSGSHWGGNEFGWPFTYASAPWNESQSQEAVEYRLYVHRMTEFTGYISPVLGPWNADIGEFCVSKLLANVAICGAIAFALAFVTRRLPMNRDGRLFQFSVVSLLVMVAVAAAVTEGLESRYAYFYVLTYRRWVNSGVLVVCAILAVLCAYTAVRNKRAVSG